MTIFLPKTISKAAQKKKMIWELVGINVKKFL